MDIKVRYYSRSGNTRSLADAIADATNTEAISVDEVNSDINEKTDILFIGGALYAYGLDKNLKEYISNLDSKNIKKAVVFSTSWISKHSVDLIKKALKNKNIDVEEKYIYYKNKPTNEELTEAKEIVKNIINNKKN